MKKIVKKYDISDIDEESSDDSACNNNHTNEIQDINNNNRINYFKDLTSDEMRLINGDMIILEKVKKILKKKICLKIKIYWMIYILIKFKII